MKRLAQSAVGTGSGTLIYTAPLGFSTDLQDIMIANTSTSAISLSLHLVAKSGSASNSNAIFKSIEVPGNTTVQWTGVQTMPSESFMQGIASASGITVTISGDEFR